MAREKRRNQRETPSQQRSFRLSNETMKMLDARARELSESRNSVAERLLNEALHTDRHPLIYFREGGSGLRRPALVGTRLHVWQILDTLSASDSSVPDAAEYLGLTEGQVRAAVDYYADFTEEVDEHRAQHREFERRERERWERSQRVRG